MALGEDKASKTAQAHQIFVRLLLPPYTIHFKSPSYVQTTTLDLLDKKISKQTLTSTASTAAVREAIGGDAKFWAELLLLLRAAIPSLERRSFSIWDPRSVDYESTSGALIAGSYPGLWRDLERLNDILSISRNVLTIGAVAQDLAAEQGIDHEVFRLINCCVRVTARGYDGDAGTGEEEKWQWIVNAYKKLLITGLQFLNNLVAQNERRKLMLWVALFDNAADAAENGVKDGETKHFTVTHAAQPPTPPPAPAAPKKPSPPITGHDILLAYGTNGNSRISPLEMEGAVPIYEDRPFRSIPTHAQALVQKNKFEPNGYVYFTHVFREFAVNTYQLHHKRSPTLAEIHRAIPTLWEEERQNLKFGEGNGGQKRLWEHWQNQYQKALATYRSDLDAYDRGELAPLPPASKVPPKPVLESAAPKPIEEKVVEEKVRALEEQLRERYRSELVSAQQQTGDMGPDAVGLIHAEWGIQAEMMAGKKDDTRMLFTAEAGAKILESGKAELMKRLEGYAQQDGRMERPADSQLPSDMVAISHRRRRSAQSLSSAFAPDSLGSEDDEEESEEDDEEDYPGSSEDGRGLLTDVPLILGPSEIEVLPMVVMSGIVAPNNTSTDNQLARKTDIENTDPVKNTHTIRTHLLLSQTSGRNLLRELLIFVAAWDLRDEELYFKFMVKIMEAILKNGLMPYAYHAFRDRSRSKDIISPAQAVIMKLLTCIFRGRNGDAKAAKQSKSFSIDKELENGLPSTPPSKVDLHILNFIFTEFRQHIIPQTCALIFLQGQIHKGKASPEDFPLNLWDMERMYEGVYQFLEFFAVLAEEHSTVIARKAMGEEEEGDVVGEDEKAISWKSILADWEMASELVTLLRELENGIPKMMGSATTLPGATQQTQLPRRTSNQIPAPPQRSLSADAAMMAPPLAIERPFDLDDSSLPPLPGNPIFEPETPLAYPDDAVFPASAHDLQHDQDEPSDFEWRNLKKLTVLVLSSLIWKNRQVQDQVRKYGGLEALVGCCKPDEHNPYIREHAIMCLRFAVEGNEENADVIRGMAKEVRRGLENGQVEHETSVPREVLDTNGYETFMDSHGQVGLRRKDHTAPTQTQTLTDRSATSSAPPQTTGNGARVNVPKYQITAERAAELMQNALKDLPLGGGGGGGGDQLVTDKEKADVLARLDRAFESTERRLDDLEERMG